jgi:two-component system, OmpR family, phosphate regulon sensor histidine kinase PhoR
MNPIKRIALILTIIFLVPVLFFSVYEISSLNKDEKMIEDIYTKQLEAILFSVNQHADNALENWVAKAQRGFESRLIEQEVPTAIQTLLNNAAVKIVFFVDSLNDTSIREYSQDSLLVDSLRPAIKDALQKNSQQIDKLIGYKKSGFQKIEVIQNSWQGNNIGQMLIFIADGVDTPFLLAGLIVDPSAVIEDIVGPRLQVIAKDQFILSVFSKSSINPVYSTQQGDTTRLNSDAFTKDLWIFPDYSLGIRTKGASLQQIVNERTNTNLIFLVGLDIVLIIALVLVFRNVKKEVQLAQNKSDFVSNVSHEIRTPLALISMFAETLEMGRAKTEEKKQEYYSIITKETQRLSGIVNKILSFSQTEAGKKKLHIESIEVTTEIQAILKTYDFHLKNKGFEYHFEPSETLLIKADKEAITEMIINLIDNAIKYSSTEKKIDVIVGHDINFGWVAVKDLGLGIAKDDQKHVFDKFYRVSSGNLAKSQGTGLGLSIVKELIEQQNGKITVSSELSKGSTFTLYFPLT